MDASGDLARGREHFALQAWRAAYESLASADRSAPLGPGDLELLATSAYMLGAEDEYRQLLARAYRGHLDDGASADAFRCAHWIGVSLASHGELGQASGWLARAERLLESEPPDCVERGYALVPQIFAVEAEGDLERASAIAGDAAAIGERFGDPDLFSLATHAQGSMLIKLGRLRDGLPLLDIAMVAVVAGEVSPVSAGIVYCGVILACEEAHELARAREWTAALSQWCEQQPDLVAFTGRCLAHRAQIMRMDGAWEDAIEEARRAADRALQGENPMAAGEAHYQRGEVLRLRGEQTEAEEAYREASAQGWEPQPGLALLRLAQGDERAAEGAIRRVTAEAREPGRRANLLPAYVEIMAAVGDLDAAEQGCAELDSIAESEEEPGALAAMASQSRALLELNAGRPKSALASLRRAAELWKRFEAPYEGARVRELIGLACRELGDEDSARLELDAARETFSRLGATADLARLEAPSDSPDGADRHGLTARELEVLRLLSAGQTNREIAADLVVSVRTVDRHVSNIYAKLGVSSRAAATGYAHEHDLV